MSVISSRSINKHLATMRAAGKLMDIKQKGAMGEAAAFDVLHGYRAKNGGILKQGFMYPYASNRQNTVYLGNIFLDSDSGRYTDITRLLTDEIDILYISSRRIIPIEVKSYHDSNITLTDAWMERGGKPVEKSPMAQAEKHARHLYHQIFDVLPDGDSRYIRPVVCLVDRCSVRDMRSDAMRQYLPVVSLNALYKTVRELDTPLAYTIDTAMLERKLNEIETR